MPTVSPAKATFSLEDQGQSFVPDHAPGLVQRNVQGNRRWRIQMSWENLSQDEQAQFKAFLASLQGRSRSFMVEVGRMTPWRGSMDAFNRFDDATAQCNVASGTQFGTAMMVAKVDHGRLRFDKVGGYGNFEYAPTSYSNPTVIQSLDLFGTYALRSDVVAGPTIQSSTAYRPLIYSTPTSYMVSNGTFRGNSGTQISSRFISPFVATNTVAGMELVVIAQGMPGDAWWVDNIYIGRAGLVDNGQNLLPFTANYSSFPLSVASLERSFNDGTGAQWLDGNQTAATFRGTSDSGNAHYLGMNLGANFKANSYALGANEILTFCLQGMLRFGTNTGSGQHFALGMQGGADSLRMFVDVTSVGDQERALNSIAGNYLYGRGWASHVGAGVSQWMRVGAQAQTGSLNTLLVAYLMTNSSFTELIDARSMTMNFGNLAMHANVWSYGGGAVVPDRYFDVPGRFVPTSTIVVSGTPQTGATLYLKGLPTSMSQAARAGDFMTLHSGELKKLTSDLNTDGFGNAVAHFEPSIVTAPAHLNPVFFGPGAYGRFILSKAPQWDLKPGFFADLTVDVEEVWEP
jgi:hypothetical protein